MKLKNLFLTFAYSAMILVAVSGVPSTEGLWEVLLFCGFIALFSFGAACNLHLYITGKK